MYVYNAGVKILFGRDMGALVKSSREGATFFSHISSSIPVQVITLYS